VVSLSLPKNTVTPSDGIRPVNLRTDLAPLADLIELVFADSMDSSGRAAVREMRYLSRMGPGLGVLAGMNDLKQGISLGYVWIADGRLVGNVSIYPANYPSELGKAWIIANVAVHPDYRGRGIARQLMQTSMASIRQRAHGRKAVAVLQVEADNHKARRLYQTLGYIDERGFTQWRRGSTLRQPPPPAPSPYITKLRRGEWREEFALAARVRPASAGGIGWMRPLHRGLFHRSLFGMFGDFVNLRSVERLIIRSQDERKVHAALWIENGFATTSTQLTVMTDAEFQGYYDDALINLAVRRFGARSPITIEHPSDENVTNAVLERYHFYPQRHLIHMRWES
jgi:ribosomal protein S18 acetylase RimI-like enzyme